MRDLGTLTVADFEPLRGDRFRVSSDGATPFESELIEITELERALGGRAPFSLVFRGGPRRSLEQRIYRVEHDNLGALEIFLVPIAADRYQAIFS